MIIQFSSGCLYFPALGVPAQGSLSGRSHGFAKNRLEQNSLVDGKYYSAYEDLDTQ